MERYLRRNRLAETLDGLGLRALFFLLATGWFIWLWGLNVPALLAGAALGILLCTARREWRKRTVHRREKALRGRPTSGLRCCWRKGGPSRSSP